MHQRDRHFFVGGTELDAPQYIYFEKLNFMREFSIRKETLPATPSNSDVVTSPNISPEHLVVEEIREGLSVFSDYTDQFLECVKDFPELYDEHAEMRKYRAKDAWKQIADLLSGKFTVGKLRQYWITLMKKYRVYLESPDTYFGVIENESMFDQLSFANIGCQTKREHAIKRYSHVQYIIQTEDEIDSSRELVGEEHLMCEEVDDGLHSNASSIDEFDTENEVQEEAEDETAIAVGSIEDSSEPETKKIKIETGSVLPTLQLQLAKPAGLNQFQQNIPPPLKVISLSKPPSAHTPIAANSFPLHEDEFDYFGKKVALQLREVAQKNRSIARKGEIKVLQLLMELEESLQS